MRLVFAIEVPQVGRKRLIAAAAMSATASGLWISAPAWLSSLPLLPDAESSGLLIFAGLTVPLGVAYVTVLLMERRILRDLADRQRRQAQRQAEQKRAEEVPTR